MIPLAYAVDTNIFNYVWNTSDWIPWLSTSDGRPKIDLNMVNYNASILFINGSQACTPKNGLCNQTLSTSLGNSTAWNKSNTNVILANTGDNVGIGISTPTSKLHVIGNTSLSGELNITERTTFNNKIDRHGIWNETWYNSSGDVVWVKGWNGTMFFEYAYG